MTTLKLTPSWERNLPNLVLHTGGKLKYSEFSQQYSEGNDLFLEQHMPKMAVFPKNSIFVEYSTAIEYSEGHEKIFLNYKFV